MGYLQRFGCVHPWDVMECTHKGDCMAVTGDTWQKNRRLVSYRQLAKKLSPLDCAWNGNRGKIQFGKRRKLSASKEAGPRPTSEESIMYPALLQDSMFRVPLLYRLQDHFRRFVRRENGRWTTY